jgi:hypothetical protein
MYPFTLQNRNHRPYGSRITRILLGLACLSGLFLQNSLAQEHSAKPPEKQNPKASGGGIHFPASLIPKIPASLPTVKLTSQAPPEDFLRDTLGKIGVNLDTIQPLSHTSLLATKNAPEQFVGVAEQDHLHAYWHRETGEIELFPEFEKLHPEKFLGKQDPHLRRAVSLAREVFARPEILPKDVTQYTIGAARPIVGSTAKRESNAREPKVSERQLYLTYVPVFRSVKGFRVYGTGSRAAIAVDNAGNINAFVKRWKAGSFSTDLREKRTPAEVHAALTKLLEPMTTDSDVEVLSVELAYYDGNRDSMLPVIRAISRLHPHARSGASPKLLKNDDFIATYVAYGDSRLPDELVPGSGPSPKEMPKNRGALPQAEVPAGDPAVGMYVVRDAPSGTNPSSGFVAESNGFWSGLQSSNGHSQFTLAQYYWAVPALYTNDEASFVNDVNIALTEAHGAPWLFTTESDCCDTVDINGIPASEGYGAANRGKLDYWIIHSCSVVPSAEDNSAWWTPWFKVFQGLHAVMGSRTEMYFDGGAVNQPFGENIGNGASVISAWFNATLSYYSASTQPPMDRPSAVTVCGHEPDTAFNTNALPAPNCLTNYWQPN